MPILLESDIRKELRKQDSCHELFWVEAATGGTFGLPDCFLADPDDRSRVGFVELKVGSLEGWGKDQSVDFTIRPEQKKVIKRMLKQGMNVWIAVGIVHTDDVYLFRPELGKPWVAGLWAVDPDCRVPLSELLDAMQVRIF